MSFPILFEILPSVVEPNLMLLQEAIEFVTRFKAEEPSQLRGGQFPLAVGFQSDGFEGGAWQVWSDAARAAESSSGSSRVSCMGEV